MPDALEVNPASEWCQRWRGRQHSWRHKYEGGFNADDYTVEPIDETAAKAYVEANHYSGSYPAAVHRYGLFADDRLAGVIVLSVPPQAKVLTSVFPDLVPYRESAELGRMVLDDPVPANAETWFMARCFEEAAAAGVRGVVSFADPCPRRIGDRLLFPGHIGRVYAAKSARFCGRGTARTILLLPDGTVLNDRSMQKIRKQERGHRYVEEKLIGFGARPIRALENPASWLNDALGDLAVTKIRHRGNYRYVFALGNPTQRRHVRIAMPTFPYPKEVDG